MTPWIPRPLRVRPELRGELRLALAVVVVATLYPALTGQIFWAQTLLLANVYLIAVVGLNVLQSLAGQFSFGHGMIFGGAAYSTAMMVALHDMPFLLASLVGIAVGVAIGLVMALPALRVQSYYLAFVTMAGALAFPELLYIFDEQTHAVTGLGVQVDWLAEELVPGLSVLGVLILAISCVSLIAFAVLRSSSFGRDMKMTGTNPEAASTMGLSPGWMRLAGFALASVFAAVAGILYIPLIGYVAPSAFTIELSVLLFLAVVVGGKGTVIGPVVGVLLVNIVPDALLADYTEYRLIIFGIIAFAVMFFMPDGVAGSARHLLRRFRGRTGGELIDLESLVSAVDVEDGAGAGAAGHGAALHVRDVSLSFGSVQALRDASMGVEPGEVHAIVGPNGSGKTTLLNVLSGLYAPDAGSVHIDDLDVTRKSSVARSRAGLGRTFQTPRVLEDLSAWENVDIGRRGSGSAAAMTAIVGQRRESWDDVHSDTLPHAQRRFLEVARVMNQGARIWLLDEPAAGLSQDERRQFGAILRSVAQRWGTTIVIVEHDLELVWSVADRISVVEAGTVIATGTPAELDERTDIKRVLVGGNDADG